MKLGFVSAILDQESFTNVIDIAAELGYQCVEVACWPTGTVERRYAGVSHIDVNALDDQAAKHILDYCKNKKVEISALAFYPNTMDQDLEKRAANILHLKKVIDAAAKLRINLVTTFIGRDQTKTVAQNLAIFHEVWPDIIAYAQQHQVKIAIENCPMLFGFEQWPGGQNLAISPTIWRKMFAAIPSDFFGLNYDPSHFVWQRMDYIKPIYEFRDKIFHVHFKDIRVDQEKLDQVGVLAYPLEYMTPKLPGLGEVNWAKYVSALNDIGYQGYACIEVEDRCFEVDQEAVLNSLRLSKRYLEQFVI